MAVLLTGHLVYTMISMSWFFNFHKLCHTFVYCGVMAIFMSSCCDMIFFFCHLNIIDWRGSQVGQWNLIRQSFFLMWRVAAKCYRYIAILYDNFNSNVVNSKIFMENSKAGRANLHVGLYLVGVYSVYILVVLSKCSYFCLYQISTQL